MTGTTAQAVVERRLQQPLAESADGIGYVGCDVPIDVFAATGRPFGHLPWRVDEATPQADRWLESGFPFWARSILEQWSEGAFDRLDSVVFSRADDASQRLFYYIRELQRRGRIGGPEPRIFDIALVERRTSLEHTAREIASLISAFALDESSLTAGMERTNTLRKKLIAIDGQRADHGTFYERLGRAALWSDATDWIDDVPMPESESTRSRPRVVLAGSAPPDDRLHRAVEAGGGAVITEAHVHALGRLGPAVVVSSDGLEQVLARHLREASVGPRAMMDRARWIIERARTRRADAVVLWLTREDEALAWHLPWQVRALEAAHIPALTITAARWQADDGAAERISDFVRPLTHAAT